MSNIGLLTSNARPEYARAAETAHQAPAGTIVVFSYRPHWFTPDAHIEQGGQVTIFEEEVEGWLRSVRKADILEAKYHDGKIIIALSLVGEEYRHEFERAPSDGKAVFTF